MLRLSSVGVAALLLVFTTSSALTINEFISSELFTVNTTNLCERPTPVHGHVQVHSQVSVGGYVSFSNYTANTSYQFELYLNGSMVESTNNSQSSSLSSGCAGATWLSTSLYDRFGPGDYTLWFKSGNTNSSASFTMVMPSFQIVSDRLELSDADAGESVCDYNAAHRYSHTITNSTYVVLCLYSKGYTPQNVFNVSFSTAAGVELLKQSRSLNSSDQPHIELRLPIANFTNGMQYVGAITYADDDDNFSQQFPFTFLEEGNTVSLQLPTTPAPTPAPTPSPTPAPTPAPTPSPSSTPIPESAIEPESSVGSRKVPSLAGLMSILVAAGMLYKTN